LGSLFKNQNTPTPDTNTEMVIILTPTVMTDKKFADAQVVMPTPEERGSAKEIYDKYETSPYRLGPCSKSFPGGCETASGHPQNTVVQQQVAQIITPPNPQG